MRLRRFRWASALCCLVLSGVMLPACKKKSYESTDPNLNDREFYSGGSGSSDGKGGGRHGSDSGSGVADEPPQHRPSRPETIPVEPNVSKNIEQSLQKRIPKGPDCDGPAKTVDCPPAKSEKTAWLLLESLVSAAHAATDAFGGLRLFPDRTFSQSQLLTFLPPESEAAELYRKIGNVHVFSDSTGAVFNSFDMVVTFTSGAEVWAKGSSDLGRACRLLEFAFPNSGKDFFEVIDTASQEKSRLRHPYQGRACKPQSLEDYRVMSFSAPSRGAASAADAVPNVVMLIAKNTKKDPSYIVNSRHRGKRELFSVLSSALAGEAPNVAPVKAGGK